jgi:hypothetical protein
VDTVHQGDWDGEKGVYHLNAVDMVTQWQVIGCAAKIIQTTTLRADSLPIPFTFLLSVLAHTMGNPARIAII